MSDGFVRKDMLAHGERIVGQPFTRGEQHYALGASGRLYRMLWSSDEDGGHETVTLVPVAVDVLVARPQRLDVTV